MSNPKSSGASTDWTQLLSDPDLVRHLGELLQAYREAPPEKREEALQAAMRRVKSGQKEAPAAAAATPHAAEAEAKPPAPARPAISPPFEPDMFTPSAGQDRRQYPRMKCFVAVELRVQPAGTLIWGNLSNTSVGGCFVETATAVSSGSSVEIGLWLANGKIWVKGIVLTGVVTKTSPSFGVRIKFAEMEASERANLRTFLKFVANATKGYQSEHGYLSQLKR